MLKEKKLFKVVNFMLSVFNPRELKTNRSKLALFISLWLLLAMKLVLFTIELVLNTTNENIAKFLQVTPTMVLISIGTINFMINAENINDICDQMDKVIIRSENKEIFEMFYKRIVPISIALSIATFMTMFVNSVVFLITGKNVIPFYMPEKEGIVFIIFWLESTFCTCCWTSVLSLFDMQSIILLCLLNAYVKTLRVKFSGINVKSSHDIKSTVELHVEFKRLENSCFIMRKTIVFI
jgi:hypothetical protein